MISENILKDKLFNINEIFYSIQGEGSRAGFPCVFIRFQGCMLRCSWCDTPYALDLKEKKMLMTAGDIVSEISNSGCKLLCLTGGEPLYQEGVKEFIKHLCDLGYTVTIETSGNLDATDVDNRAVKIIDMKCPASGMTKLNNYVNLEKINELDEVKFVLANREDYEWAAAIVKKYELEEKCSILFSPVFGVIDLQELAKWILDDKLKVRYQLQLHKFIWDPSTRGV
jgi:7-carboxy-7-deazaguanine synthase